jgi:ArsR family transcriptional regulator
MKNHEFYCLHSDLCKTLANPKRQLILDALRNGEVTVGDLVNQTGIPQANVSQHLSILRNKGIVVARRHGSRVNYSITNPKIIKAFDLISEVLNESLAGQSRTVNKAVGKTHLA